MYKEPGSDVQRGLKAGDRLEIDVRTWFRVHAFNGEKHVVVTDVSRLGGKNQLHRIPKAARIHEERYSCLQFVRTQVELK